MHHSKYPQNSPKAFPASGWTRSGNNYAFTLVELIVVVTILAILATIGFVSYSSYLTGVRDTNRLSQLVSISDGLELYRTKKDLPLPDDNVEVQVNGTTIAFQGYAGSNTLETIDFTKGGKDPKDDSYFTYYLTQDRKYYQLLGFLEEEENITSYNYNNNGNIISQVQAVDYENRIPTVYGKKLGVLTDTTNTPLQELVSGQLDLQTDDTTSYIAHLSDDSTLTGSTAGNSNLEYLENTGVGGGIASSCKTLIDRNSSLKGKDGVYIIDPEGGEPFAIYCKMQTDGGGWHLIGSKSEAGSHPRENLGEGLVVIPGSNSNVWVRKDIFRNNLTELLACSTQNCWKWEMFEDFINCLETFCGVSGTSVTGTGDIILVEGNSSFKSISITNAWYNYNNNASNRTYLFRVWKSGAEGVGAYNSRHAMDGDVIGDWQLGDQWDLYVR